MPVILLLRPLSTGICPFRDKATNTPINKPINSLRAATQGLQTRSLGGLLRNVFENSCFLVFGPGQILFHSRVEKIQEYAWERQLSKHTQTR